MAKCYEAHLKSCGGSTNPDRNYKEDLVLSERMARKRSAGRPGHLASEKTTQKRYTQLDARETTEQRKRAAQLPSGLSAQVDQQDKRARSRRTLILILPLNIVIVIQRMLS